MEKVLTLIQEVQDAFANHYKLSLLIIDLDGIPITEPSRRSKLTKLIHDEKKLNMIARMKEVSVLDVYPGLKVIVSPVHVLGEIKYHLCAGMLIEEDTRPYLYQYFDSEMQNSEEWKQAIDEIPNTSKEEKKSLVEKMKSLSYTICRLLESDEKNADNQQLLDGIHQITVLSEDKNTLSQITQQFVNLDSNLDFAGFATRVNEEDFIISHISGDEIFQPLVGTSFTVGEGFLGYAVATGNIGSWSNIWNDPRNVVFIKHQIRPESLVSIPVQKENKVLGVFFAGSCRKKEINPLTIESGKIVANILRDYVTKKNLMEDLSQQIHQLNALMEISQLITRVKDIKKITYMLVDMSLNIIQGKFAAITLFDVDTADEVRIVSRGLTSEQSEKYGRLLLQDYSSTNNYKKTSAELVNPSTRKLEWGTTVIEFPIMNQKFHGVLSLEMNHDNRVPNAFLSSLALVGAFAIEQVNQKQDAEGQYVNYLHHAISQFDKKEYEFTKEIKEYALLFSEHLEIQKEDIRNIENACLLSFYHPNFLRDMMPNEESVIQILEDYHKLSSMDTVNSQTIGIEGQILMLVAQYIKNKHSIPLPIQSQIDKELQEKFYSFHLSRQVVDQRVSTIENAHHQIEGLSNREQEVLQLVVKGLNNKQIANHLFISEHTVKNHITKIFQKLGISDRAGAMAYFYQKKIH